MVVDTVVVVGVDVGVEVVELVEVDVAVVSVDVELVEGGPAIVELVVVVVLGRGRAPFSSTAIPEKPFAP